MSRRSTHIDQDVVYAAVGASAAPDLQRFPPEGATAYYEELKLGSGPDRFLTASSVLMTWGAQRAIGMEVADIEPGEGAQYTGVTFNGDGTPEAPVAADVQYGPDGEPFLTTGTTAKLTGPNGRAERRIRVIYTVDEPRRVGFAWGSADEAAVIGEQALVVEHRDDDSVWATVRGFLWTTDDGLLGLKGKSLVRSVLKDAKRLIAALAPGVADAPNLDGAGEPEVDGAGAEGAAPGDG